MTYAAEYRGYPGDGEAEGPRPWLLLVALAAGLIVTIAATLLLMKSELTAEPLILLGGMLCIGLAVWLALRMILLRHAPIGWTIAACALLGPTSLGVGLIHLAWESVGVKRDSEAVAIIGLAAAGERDPKVPVVLPPAKGPMSRITRRLYAALLAEERIYVDVIERSGFNELSSPAALTAKGSVITDCGRLAAVRKAFDRQDRRGDQLIKATRRDPELANIPARLRPEFIRGMEAGFNRYSPEAKQIAKLEIRMIENWQGVCKVLARRGWSDSDDKFMFHNTGDYEEFNRLTRSIDAASTTQQALKRQFQESIRRQFARIANTKAL